MKNKKVHILRTSGDRDRYKVYLDTLPLGPDEKPVKATTELYKKTRSLAQNNLMWKWLAELSNFLRNDHGTNATPEDLKDHFQRTHLGNRPYELDGQMRIRLVGTSDLNTAQFTEFLNRIEEYSNNAGLILPHPEDIYYEAMGYDKR